jgi:hypothetical protein
MAEVGRLQIVATESQAELEEQTRLLAEEQDRHHDERETLLAQRTLLEQELGSAIEQLAAASSTADRREAELQQGSQRLLEALDAVRRLTAELVGGSVEPAEETEVEPEPELEAEPELEPEAEAEGEDSEAVLDDLSAESESESDSEPDSEPETGEIEYSLFVPGPNGYEMMRQTGVPPLAGQSVELVLPDEDNPVRYEVVRTGRTLPGGDVCVYLAQV